jgi:hypothetical protein
VTNFFTGKTKFVIQKLVKVINDDRGYEEYYEDIKHPIMHTELDCIEFYQKRWGDEHET